MSYSDLARICRKNYEIFVEIKRKLYPSSYLFKSYMKENGKIFQNYMRDMRIIDKEYYSIYAEDIYDIDDVVFHSNLIDKFYKDQYEDGRFNMINKTLMIKILSSLAI